ncbi:NAD(P)-dependent oxidoreductase [Methanoregula sp.]|jgi:UDP-glucose 4-epimerase|uniref:NAD-dependent epimerase/dehydratase family protein n=1 Tax=Methanoregula sp. TaxID=2052170 RepID=UPI0025E735CD|nr:NAD(P)-dependent oxidoreductase [Methanoregula sp.]
MRALVTGGSGFVGHHLVKELTKNNIETVVYDLSRSPGEGTHNPLCTFIQGDVLDCEKLTEAMNGCDYVFHTAAIADVDQARKIPRKTMEVNVIGTTNCLEAAKENKVKRFLFASTVYVSGNRGSFYRLSKQTCESLCKTYHEEFGLEFTTIRYGSLYGREPNHWNFIYGVCKSLLTTGEFTYSSSPDAVREYIHINDAARETVRIAGDPQLANKAVLITGHQRMKMSEFFDMVTEILGGNVRIHYAAADNNPHYVITPYSFNIDVPVRVNLSTYVDISEGILDCLKEVQKELDQENNP